MDGVKNGKLKEKVYKNGGGIMTATTIHEEGAGDGHQCGLGLCKPRWLQLFASKQAFLVTFCITWVLQGMYYTYFVSVVTTIEKLFRLQSKTTGFIMSATEVGQIGSSLLLTYYGGQGHRPKWIAWGMVLFAACSFTSSLPHFILGPEMSSPSLSNSTTPSICIAPSSLSALNSTVQVESCADKFLEEQELQSKKRNLVLAIFFTSLLGAGMGQTAVYTLGIPYIDDNVASRESPLYFSITIGVRIMGPALGFILGSVCTRLYVDLTVVPDFTPSDPRWVGAWWLGLVLIASLLMLASLAMFAFPSRLSTCRSHTPAADKRALAAHHPPRKNPSLRDFPKAVKRLLKNDLLMYRTASSVLHILPIAGIYVFLPKYLESQFRLTAHAANMVSGVGGILVMGLGIILSGVFILKVKPNARFVAGWIAFTAFLYALGMGILMFVGCPMNDFAGLQRDRKQFEPTCRAPCTSSCNDTFSPVCGRDGRTYHSACFAGCSNSTRTDGNIIEFSDCSCVGESPLLMPGELASATMGYCPLECNNFQWYIILFSLFVFIHSTSEVGSMLLILRCVDPRDKAMALGLIQFAIGLFGNVPCPIVYGAVVDSACLIWETTCGKQGACKLYDENYFRMFYHGTTGAIMMVAFLVDVLVWYKAGSINFVDETTTAQEEELNPFTSTKSRSETTSIDIQ